MRKLNAQQGFTLIEILLASAIFVMLMGGVSYGVIVAMRAQEFDKNVREAQIATRNALNRLTDELRSATILPTTGLGKSLLPSGVIHPDSYGHYTGTNGGGPYGDPFYSCGTEQAADGKRHYYSNNLLIFTRPKTDTTTGSFNASNMQEYVYVEWLVPKAARNRIYRKTHRIMSKVAGPIGHMLSGGQWLLQPTYFTSNSYLTTSGTDENDWVIAKLPGAEDYFNIHVSHAPYTNPNTGGLEGIESPYGTSYERNLFNVTIKAAVYRRGFKRTDSDDTAQNRKNVRSVLTVTSQVRIQAGI